jgi:hypothetical protein
MVLISTINGDEVWLNEVEEAPIYVGKGLPVRGYKLLHVKGKPFRQYAVVTENYTPVQHHEVILKTREHILHHGFDIKEDVIEYSGRYRSRLFYKVVLWEYEPISGDKIGLGLLITNSYDTSLALGIYGFALRLVCTNEMVFSPKGWLDNQLISLRTLHVGEVWERFDEALGNALRNMEDIQIFIKRMIGAKVPVEEVIRILNRMKLAETYKIRIQELIGKKKGYIDLWEAYNHITYVLTHETKKWDYMKRMEYLTKLNREVEKILVKVQAQRS